MTELARYDAACAALAAAVKADEVMHVHLEAKAIAAVARVAQNLDLEIHAHKLRTRAEVRLGEMLRQAEERGIIAARGGQRKNEGSDSEPSPATLKDIGVDKKLSAQSRKLADLGGEAVDRALERFEIESRERGRIASGVIQGELGKRNTESRRQLARELSDATALQPSGRRFPVVYADPAWLRKAGVGNRAYENHYTTMTWDQIIGMPVAKRVLPDAWLFLWIPRAHVLALHPTEIETPLGRAKVPYPLASAVAQGWGFDAYSTAFVWTKTDDEFPDDSGLGLIAWDQDELLLLFKRGRGLPKPDIDKKYGSNHRERAGGHSAKPTFYRDMINDMTGGVPVLELFAREDDEHVLPPNFFTWGNQSKNTAELPEHDPETGEVIEPHHPGDVTDMVDAPTHARVTDDPIGDRSARLESEIAPAEQSAEEPATDHQAQPSPAVHPIEVEDIDIPPFLRRAS
jgi:N6-adenosine-specific RNA methylase IME4